jgi:hypothetical protein
MRVWAQGDFIQNITPHAMWASCIRPTIWSPRILGLETSASPRIASWSVLAISFLISWGVWHWALHIVAPANAIVVAAAQRPVGNHSDLYPRWFGARELLLHRRNPYGPDVTREIQLGFYGRVLNAQNPSDPTARESFVDPLYVVFLLAPAALLPFPIAAAVFRWLLLASIALSVPLWMFAIRFRARWPIVLSAMLLATSTSPAIVEYFQQNLTALVILFLAGAAAALVGGRLVPAGVLLALSTVKPDISTPMVLWLLFWAIAERRERSRLIWGFAGSMAALVLAAEFILPHWYESFFAAVREYRSYGTDRSIIQLLLPAPLAIAVSAALICYVVFLCWKWRHAPADSEYFAWMLAWVSVTTVVTLPKLPEYNALLLLPAFLIIVARYQTSPKDRILARSMMKGAFACQLWQWCSAGLLSICSPVIPAASLQRAAHVPEVTFYALWIMTFAAVVTNSPRLEKNLIAKKI